MTEETPRHSEDAYDLRDIAKYYYFVEEALCKLHDAVCTAERLKDLESDHFELEEYHRAANEAYENLEGVQKDLKRVLVQHGLLKIVTDYNEHYTKRR